MHDGALWSSPTTTEFAVLLTKEMHGVLKLPILEPGQGPVELELVDIVWNDGSHKSEYISGFFTGDGT